MKRVIAFGMTMVIISGEIDLSVASMVALSGCFLAFLTKAGLPIAAGILLTLALGASIGSFTGVLRSRFRVPSFITTLAILTGLRGAALMLTGGFALTPFPDWYNFLGGGIVLGIPFPALVFLLTFAIVHVLMNHTAFGRAVYAVGGNAEAARLSGINIAKVRIAVLAITSMLATLAGVMLSSRMLAGDPTVAQGWELDVIAAVIVGGHQFVWWRRAGVGHVNRSSFHWCHCQWHDPPQRAGLRPAHRAWFPPSRRRHAVSGQPKDRIKTFKFMIQIS